MSDHEQMIIDREGVRKLREYLGEKLKQIGEEVGLSIELIGSSTFTDSTVTFKVAASTKNSDGSANSPQVAEFKRRCFHWGMLESDIGRRFMSQGVEYTVVGATTGAKKYPIVVSRVRDGKRFRLTVQSVKLGLFDAAAAAE